MQKVTGLVQISALIVLSAFSGSLLFIALVMVKFWQSLEPQDFLNWMTNDLYLMPKTMIPLNILSLVLAIAALATSWKAFPSRRLPLSLGLASILFCSITFPIYFAGANAEFVTQSIEISNVTSRLSTWSTWHWVRTGLAILAVACSAWNLLIKEPGYQTDKIKV